MPTPLLLRRLLHGSCFLLPLCTWLYLLAAPSLGLGALAWPALLVGCIVVDLRASPERTQPPPDPSEGAPPRRGLDGGDVVLLLLVALQLLNVAGLAALAAGQGWLHWRTALGGLMVGTSSGYSAIVVAHELVHRRERWQRGLGRLLLVTVLYDHFATEHVRGHHVRVATGGDPATARHGEALLPFLLRTVPGQLRSAWRLEAERLGSPPAGSPRWLGSAVLQGMVAQAALLVLVGALWGPAGLAAWLHQAFVAVLLLESVNYVEHWGLTRAGRRVTTVDSWDTESWFSYYSLVGLTRHADHHAWASRPYTRLRHVEESPKMPHGYWGMVVRALFDNRRLRADLDGELRRRGLGPYRPAEAQRSATAVTEPPGVATA